MSRDAEEALSFDVSLFNRLYKFKIFSNGDSANLKLPPGLSEPDFVILCFDISNRESLRNARYHWRRAVALTFYDPRDRLPIMLLGLKRDLRGKVDNFVLPQEAFGEAQQMSCDRYAECSAKTGELMWEVLEDITKTAAKTTTEAGGRTQGSCIVV
jgi:Ras family protein A